MKGSRKFILLFIAIFTLYVVAELNRPKPLDWSVTLAKADKNPFGGYILFNRLKDIFSASQVKVASDPIYNLLNDEDMLSAAYIIISPTFKPSKNDLDELRQFVHRGNTAFISAINFDKLVLTTFRAKTDTRFTLINKDSTSVNLVNPSLKAPKDYTSIKNTINEYFTKIDTAFATILGVNDEGQPNFIKLSYGKGNIYLHAAPICFSNYFILNRNNHQYSSAALSYITTGTKTIYWDEYYKPGGQTKQTPLYFILSNTYLLWALRLTMAGLLIYVLFAMKRRQRIIPVVEPLRNSSLDFVQTISNVYFNHKDNAGIADKKISYFFEFIRHRFYMQTTEMDETFIETLSRKSGIPPGEIQEIVRLLKTAQNSHDIDDDLLLSLDRSMDNFYKQV